MRDNSSAGGGALAGGSLFIRLWRIHRDDRFFNIASAINGICKMQNLEWTMK